MLTAVITAAAITAGTVTAPSADDSASTNDTNQVAAQVASAVDTSNVVHPKRDGDNLTADTANGNVTLPATSDGDVVVAPENAGPVRIGLPLKAAARARVAADGTVVYGGRDVSVTVQALPTAVRASTVIADASAPTNYAYTFEGLKPRLNVDGTVTLSSEGHGISADVAQIDAPWARDAAGTQVPTHYEIAGDTVTQVVDFHTGNYQFPIVADPSVQHDCGIISCTWRFNRATTENIRDYGIMTSVVAALAATAIWPIFIAVGSAEWATWAGRYYGHGNCLGFRYYGVASKFVEVKRGTYNCS